MEKVPGRSSIDLFYRPVHRFVRQKNRDVNPPDPRWPAIAKLQAERPPSATRSKGSIGARFPRWLGMALSCPKGGHVVSPAAAELGTKAGHRGGNASSTSRARGGLRGPGHSHLSPWKLQEVLPALGSREGRLLSWQTTGPMDSLDSRENPLEHAFVPHPTERNLSRLLRVTVSSDRE